MASVLLNLGGFKFRVGAAAYNQLVRVWKWNWAGQSRVGTFDALQYTGKANDTISLNGEIATTYKNAGTRQIQALADLGNKGKPLLLVSGTGEVLGYWSMTDLSETNTSFLKGGLARFQTFSLGLKFYGDSV